MIVYLRRLLAISILLTLSLVACSQSIYDLARTGSTDQLLKRVKSFPDSINIPNERGYTVLILAAYHDHYDAVKGLIDAGADINKGFGGGTALHGACYKGYTSIAKLLLDSGIDVNLEDANGTTAIKYSTLARNVELSLMVLERGADVDIRDSSGFSAFDYAKQMNIKELVEAYSKKSKEK